MTKGLLLWALLAAPAAAQSSSSMTLRAVDLYRSESLTYEKVRAATGHSLDNYLRVASQRKRESSGALERLRQEVLTKLKAAAPLAYVNISIQEYLISFERYGNVTIDAVDQRDAAARMPFYPAPKGAAGKDAETVLALWRQYVDTGEALSREGKIQASQRPACPGFYCLWGSPTPELAALEKRIALDAVAKRRDLMEAFRQSSDPRQRAAAVYVLAYSTSGVSVAQLAVEALRDPSEEVRSAGMQVLSDIAVYHKETAPVQGYYEAQGKYMALSGVGSVESITASLSQKIQAL